jgi:hypothetical protein
MQSTFCGSVMKKLWGSIAHGVFNMFKCLQILGLVVMICN